MRPIWKILIVAAVVIGGVAVLLVVPHYRAKAAVRAYRKQLKQQGEKATIAELTPPVSAGDARSGRELIAAATLAGKFTTPPMMHWLAPGRAMVGWAEVNSTTDQSTNGWPDFIANIKARGEITKQIVAALQGNGVAFNLDYSQGFNLLLPHLAQVKRAGVWLSGAAMAAMHEHDTNAAWEEINSASALARKNRSEPLMICQLVRWATMHVVLSATWEALHYPGWTDAQLAELQRNWDSFDPMDEVGPALSMERAMQEMAFEDLRKSFTQFTTASSLNNRGNNYDTLGDALINPKEGIPTFLGKYPRYLMWKWWGSYDEELYAMQMVEAALEAARVARAKDVFIPALQNFNQTVTNVLQKDHPGWQRRFVFADSLAQTASRFLTRAADAEVSRRMVVTAIALERHRLAHGEYPATLAEMTPGILQKVPIDFMDGKPLRYHRRNDGTYLLYSVGEDGKDDGGDGSPAPPETANNSPMNYAMTTMSGTGPWYKMRDAVWPEPATAEEVKKYEAEIQQKITRKPPGRLVPQIIPAPAGTNSTTN